jgi:hypothetical protein
MVAIAAASEQCSFVCFVILLMLVACLAFALQQGDSRESGETAAVRHPGFRGDRLFDRERMQKVRACPTHGTGRQPAHR